VKAGNFFYELPVVCQLKLEECVTKGYAGITTVIDDDKAIAGIALLHLLDKAVSKVACLSRRKNVLSPACKAQDTDVLLCDVRMRAMSGRNCRCSSMGQSNVPMC